MKKVSLAIVFIAFLTNCSKKDDANTNTDSVTKVFSKAYGLNGSRIGSNIDIVFNVSGYSLSINTFLACCDSDERVLKTSVTYSEDCQIIKNGITTTKKGNLILSSINPYTGIVAFNVDTIRFSNITQITKVL